MATAARRKRPLLQASIGAAIGIVLAAQLIALGVVFGTRHQETAGGGDRVFFYPTSWRVHDTTLAWLGRTAAPGDVIATSTPHRLYLTTGFHAVMPPFEADVAESERLLASVPVTYLVIDDLDFLDVSRRYAAPTVAAHPDRWTLVYEAPEGGSRVYRARSPRT